MASAKRSAENCNRLVFEAVNEISDSKFKLVISSYSQIQVLTSLVSWNDKGETPLVIAMKGGNVSLIDELVKFLQNCDRETGKCHELSLFAIDQLFYHQIPIIDLIFHLTKHLCGDSHRVGWLDFFAQVVFKSTSLSRPNKITALELIGASFPKNSEDSVAVMFRCWRVAMFLRYFPDDGEPLLPKIPYVGVPSVASSVLFGSAVEVISMNELNLLQKHYERDVVDPDVQVRKRCIDLLKRQSLLVIRRISSQTNHGHPHWFYLQSLDPSGKTNIQDCYYYGVDFIVRPSVNSKIVFNTFMLILEQFDPILLPRQSFNVFSKSLGIVSHYLAFMARHPPSTPGREELTYANLLTATKFIGTIAKCFPNPAIMYFSFINGSFKSFPKIICDLVYVLESMSPHLNNQQKKKLEEYLSNYILNYFPKRTTSVLHAGVRGLLKFRTSDNLKPIKRMIKLGADPNAMDGKGRTPLHILAEKENAYTDENLPIFQAIVDAGAHLDMAADNGDTVLDILKRNKKLYKDRGVIADAYFSSLINTVFPLSCYCARVIRQNGIDEDRLPLHLQEFVSRHSAKGSIDLHQHRDY